MDAEAYLNAAQQQVQSLLERKGTIRIGQLRHQFQECMSQHCGVFRTEEIMQEGLEQLQQLKQQYDQVYLDDQSIGWNTEVIEALELQSLMIVGEMILTSAFKRQESRGAHSREDYPSRDDGKFLQHTLAYYSPAGIDLKYMPVTITRFEPKERKY